MQIPQCASLGRSEVRIRHEPIYGLHQLSKARHAHRRRKCASRSCDQPRHLDFAARFRAQKSMWHRRPFRGAVGIGQEAIIREAERAPGDHRRWAHDHSMSPICKSQCRTDRIPQSAKQVCEKPALTLGSYHSLLAATKFPDGPNLFPVNLRSEFLCKRLIFQSHSVSRIGHGTLNSKIPCNFPC